MSDETNGFHGFKARYDEIAAMLDQLELEMDEATATHHHPGDEDLHLLHFRVRDAIAELAKFYAVDRMAPWNTSKPKRLSEDLRARMPWNVAKARTASAA